MKLLLLDWRSCENIIENFQWIDLEHTITLGLYEWLVEWIFVFFISRTGLTDFGFTGKMATKSNQPA